jgi:hypothetical protein
MFSAGEFEALARVIEALTDKELIAEAERLLANAPDMRRELREQWNAMIAETSAVLGRRFARRATKKEARGRLRSFCRMRREYE